MRKFPLFGFLGLSAGCYVCSVLIWGAEEGKEERNSWCWSLRQKHAVSKKKRSIRERRERTRGRIKPKKLLTDLLPGNKREKSFIFMEEEGKEVGQPVPLAQRLFSFYFQLHFRLKLPFGCFATQDEKTQGKKNWRGILKGKIGHESNWRKGDGLSAG